jgi:polyphosphate glucokinase
MSDQPTELPTGPVKAPSGAGPRTLAIDIGGTGLKASVLDDKGAMLVDRVRIPTTYPLAPQALIDALRTLVAPLPAYDRIAAGFPGMVRGGRVLSAPHFVTQDGPGTRIVPLLVAAWSGYDLAAALEKEFGKPARVANDADMQGGAVVKGEGLEVVITLGTGLGTAIYQDGHLAPHIELAHHPFRNGETYDEQVGDAARKRVGKKKWNKRVREAVNNIDALLAFDHLYVGGGNAGYVDIDLGPKATIVDNSAGITGGLRLWDPVMPADHLGGSR